MPAKKSAIILCSAKPATPISTVEVASRAVIDWPYTLVRITPSVASHTSTSASVTSMPGTCTPARGSTPRQRSRRHTRLKRNPTATQHSAVSSSAPCSATLEVGTNPSSTALRGQPERRARVATNSSTGTARVLRVALRVALKVARSRAGAAFFWVMPESTKAAPVGPVSGKYVVKN